MQRRNFIKNTIGLGLAMHPLLRAWSEPGRGAGAIPGRRAGAIPGGAMLPGIGETPLETGAMPPGTGPILPALAGPPKPVFIYNNWSAYDELSDNKPQTEALATRELNQILRLKKQGVEIDYYVMDAFWFDLWGGYRTWNKQHWPNGPDAWLEGCKQNGIKPGMWFSTNLIATHSGRFLEVIPEWKDSLGTDPNIMCLFDGGYLSHLAKTLQLWYDKGVRLFKFDFAYFEAVTPAMKDKYTKEEVLEKNKTAFMQMLQAFRGQNPDVLLTGYNGFGGNMENTYTPFDGVKIDPRWLDTFDTLYCGDPRFSDVPMMNIWRSQDNYSDHQVSAYRAYGMPIRRIDNCAFMIGQTGTCYYRGSHCWKGMLLLELARGGWVNVYHGNLELLTDKDGAWFGRAQALYGPLQRLDGTVPFGAIPGSGKPYGFLSAAAGGMVYTVVNPSQAVTTIELPNAGQEGAVADARTGRILYTDGGYRPALNGALLTLGPEQLVVVGVGGYNDPGYYLGVDETIHIPTAIEPVGATFASTGKNTIEGDVTPVKGRALRIILQQFDSRGNPYRSWPGAPPDGKKVSEVIRISATQNGREVPLQIEYDKVIWSGLSWGAAEIRNAEPGPIHIRCSSADTTDLNLVAHVYAVTY